ncbi:ArsA-related P-loop ATPase, partial [Bacillus sp. Bva_UNVM-123]|uniref:ArsA-related P-loop ATPase n=1 Tax=Bacillus sp. Bva_UNVM-123 TaxID=2829798 RepID=UPI00391F7521
SVRNLLPKLRDDSYTSIIITTLPEATPVFEATRLEEDLKRADITIHWWVMNQSFYITDTEDPILTQKAQAEINWIQRVDDLSHGQMVIIPWSIHEPKGIDGLKYLLQIKY